MAEALGIVSSIISILQATQTVITYVREVDASSQERSDILSEANNLFRFFLVLKDKIPDRPQPRDPWYTTLKSFEAPDGPLEQLKVLLERLASKLKCAKVFKKFGNALFWPFRRQEVKEILDSIERQKNLISLALEKDHMDISLAIKTEVDGTYEKLTDIETSLKYREDQIRDQEYQAILDWLSPNLKFWIKQYDFFGRYQDDTCAWILDDPEFKEWLSGTNGILWCPGMPGAGKTILSSFIINHLQQKFVDEDDIAVVGVFNNYKERETPTTLIGSLLQQIALQQSNIPEDLRRLYKDPVTKDTRPFIKCSTLRTACHRFSKLFVIVDALDECAEESRDEFLQELRDLGPTLHLMITSRPSIMNITDYFRDAVQLDIRANIEDIKRYVKERLQRDSKLRQKIEKDPSLSNDIIHAILDKADGMFLMAQFHLDSLAAKRRPKDIREALSHLPKSVPKMYDEIVARILEQEEDDVNLAKQVLGWTINAKRPLSIAELQHAIAVGIDDEKIDELFEEADLASVCCGLVTVDSLESRIRLIHYTAQEYFEGLADNKLSLSQATMAKTCLRYLGLVGSDGPCPYGERESWRTRLGIWKFCRYAAQFWADHARGEAEGDSDLLGVLFSVLACDKKKDSMLQLQAEVERPHNNTPLFVKGQTWLHVVAANGLVTLIKRMLPSKEKGYDHIGDLTQVPDMRGIHREINAQDEVGWTALHVAASEGQTEVVKVLSDVPNVDANMRDLNGGTALHVAAGAEMVEVLLDVTDVDVRMRDNNGRTALHKAALDWETEVVKMLLNARDVDVNMPDNGGTTALHMVLLNPEVVKLLLDAKADVNIQDKDGETALHRAATWGEIEVIELLLEANADVNTRNNAGSTALHTAALRRRAEVVELLLAAKADVNIQDKRGATALHIAAAQGSADVVELLLNANVNVNTQTNAGSTALHTAALHRRAEVVELLLAAKVDVNIQDKRGATALYIAKRYGPAEVVALLARCALAPE